MIGKSRSLHEARPPPALRFYVLGFQPISEFSYLMMLP